jgi:BMFP domain-containing protein YqiC
MPRMIPKALDEVIETVTRLLPQTPEDVRKNMRAALAGVFERFDLVTREELDVQEAVLQRTRARLEELEKRIAELEAKSK